MGIYVPLVHGCDRPPAGQTIRYYYWKTISELRDPRDTHCIIAPMAYQVIFEPGIGQFREFEPRPVHPRINSLELFLVLKLSCGKREESVS